MFARLSLFKVHFPKWIISWVLLFTDILAGYIAFKNIIPADKDISVFIGIMVLWTIAASLYNLYQGQFTVSRIGEIQLLVQVAFGITVFYIFLDTIGLIGHDLNSQIAMKFWFVFFVGSTSLRMVVRTYQKHLLKRGVGRERAAILGYNERGKSTANLLLGHDQQGYDVVGFIKAEDDPENGNGSVLPVLGKEIDLLDIAKTHRITTLVISFLNPEMGRLMDVTVRVNGYPIDIKVIPDLSEIVQGFVRTEQIAGLPLLSIHPVHNSFYMKFVKRTLDFLFSIIFMILTIPIWILVSIAIKLDSEGPILYKQVRSGYKNKEFNIYKFRSMIVDAEAKTGPVWAGGQDPRITKVGGFLRRFRLDEIPQLINVIKGDMSLIGPRPERPYFVKQLVDEFPFYKRRLNVYPGISGWSQIKHPPDEKIDDVREKLKYDFYYIENLSWNLDLKIALSTIWVILTGQGR